MSDARPENVSTETHAKVRSWIYAWERVRDARAQLDSAECDLMNAEVALGKWIVPTDAKPRETFNIWYEDGLLCVKVTTTGDYDLFWRVVPKEKGGEPMDPS